MSSTPCNLQDKRVESATRAMCTSRLNPPIENRGSQTLLSHPGFLGSPPSMAFCLPIGSRLPMATAFFILEKKRRATPSVESKKQQNTKNLTHPRYVIFTYPFMNETYRYVFFTYPFMNETWRLSKYTVTI